MKKPKIFSQSNQKCSQCFKITNTKEKICVRCRLKSNLQTLITAKMISQDDIPKLLQYLETPAEKNEIGSLSFASFKIIIDRLGEEIEAPATKHLRMKKIVDLKIRTRQLESLQRMPGIM